MLLLPFLLLPLPFLLPLLFEVLVPPLIELMLLVPRVPLCPNYLLSLNFQPDPQLEMLAAQVRELIVGPDCPGLLQGLVLCSLPRARDPIVASSVPALCWGRWYRVTCRGRVISSSRPPAPQSGRGADFELVR